MKRIYAGLIKFVAGGEEAFMIKYNSMSRNGKYQPPSVEEPCPVVTTQSRIGFAKVYFLSKNYSGRPQSKNIPIDGPAGTITTVDHHSFITTYYGKGSSYSTDRPAPTVTTRDRMAFIDMQYGNGYSTSICQPAPTVTVNPKHQVVLCKKWIMDTGFQNIGRSVEQPSPVITANRKWHYLMNPQYESKGSSVQKPCFTLIARMDKQPPYLIAAVKGNYTTIAPNDSNMTKKIKTFMQLYGISDIKMRMLRILELLQIQGFPPDYKLLGTKAEQKKCIGNAVEVKCAKELIKSFFQNL